ncbi:neuropeptide CCHamide-2-like isoform X1 [Rhynchophorus ferrugineus]|uniref:Uncharacterized protein n=1 Tax=Rhynchophorus ferrugineus TaxID=354439 RepID=A0A834I2Q8_RHYFE|nr:hypothetical protein GWI33_013938 [Rhynchophorus ferrugineus]
MLCFTPFQIFKLSKFLILASLLLHEIHAKSGCSNFGHSCFGALGKRSELTNENYEMVQNGETELESSPYGYAGLKIPIAYPKRFYKSNRMSAEQYDELNKIIRDWIVRNRKQEEPEIK